MESFRTFWTQSFGPVAPLSWEMRPRMPEAWFRIHTLPESKRWPESEAEHAEISRRQCAVAAEVLGVGEPCWVVVPSFERRAASVVPELSGLDFQLGGIAEGQDDAHVEFWVARSRWKPETFQGALRGIAEDRLRVLWASDTGSVFAPYDGGVDMFSRSQTRLDAWKTRFAEWKSRHPAGL